MARIKLPKEPKEPKPPREPKQPREQKQSKEVKQPKEPKLPKEPKPPKELKPPKEPKPPKVPKTPKQPKQPKPPKEPKPPKPPKEPKQQRQPKVPKPPKVPKEPKQPRQPAKIRIKATILKKTAIVAKKPVPNGEKPKKRNTTAKKKLSSTENSNVYDSVKVEDEDLVGDSCAEETVIDVKLQDIANIVIGDLKQVRVNETPFNLDPEQLSVVYSTTEVSKNDNGNTEETENSTAVNWVQDRLDDKCVDIEIVDGNVLEVEENVISEDEENVDEGEEVIEVFEMGQCSPVADTSTEEVIMNGDCDIKSPKSEHIEEAPFEKVAEDLVDAKFDVVISSDEPVDQDIELSLDDNKVEINDENGCEMMTLPSTESRAMDEPQVMVEPQPMDCDVTTKQVNEGIPMQETKSETVPECPTEQMSKLDISKSLSDSCLPATTWNEVDDRREDRAPSTSESVVAKQTFESVPDVGSTEQQTFEEAVCNTEESKPLQVVEEEEDEDEISADDDGSGNRTDDDFIVLDDSEIPSSEAKMHQLAAIACSNAYRLPFTPPSEDQHKPFLNTIEPPVESFASSNSSQPSSELARLSDDGANTTEKTGLQPRHPSPSLPHSECEASSELPSVSWKEGVTLKEDADPVVPAILPASDVVVSSWSKKTANKNNAVKRIPKETAKKKKSSFVPQEECRPLKKRGPKPHKKGPGEESNNKSKEASSKKKSSKDDSMITEDDSPVKNLGKRRRSNRIKSKPEYIEKKEEVKLLAALKGEKEKLGNENDVKLENDSNVSGWCSNNCEQVPKVMENLVRVAESTDMPAFQLITDNEYHTERSFSKDAERMICDCTLSKEEIIRGERGCGEDCLNRLLLIECCSRCTLGERCTNKRFQKKQYAKCEAYKTQKKGYGLRVLEDVPSGTFLMEYVGEVIDSDEFEDRAVKYAREKIPHFYFMSLKSDCIIDATIKGNYSRFINHSCEPNAETQKWTVQGELRVGFFSKREINAGEEITFDYQLQRYGKQAQRCYCEAPSCTGWIGDDPDKQIDDDKRKEKKKKKREEYLDWETALDEISQVGLINRHQTLNLNRLMVHAKELALRKQILQLIEEGHPACRRLFVDYQGLPIIWSWMVDCGPNQDELRIQLLKTLMALPITNKTILIDSKVFSLVEQWAFAVEQKIQSEVLSAQSVLESVEDIASAEETPVSELAQKVLNQWSSLREAYRIPKKERIQQMKEHEREADQNVVKPRPRRLPLYAEKMRDSYHRNRCNRNKDFEKIYFDRLKDRRKRDSPERGRNFDREHHRKQDSSGNKMSRMEHRYMFEMKIREKEERKREEELMKRKWETEDAQNYWMQQNQNMYYGSQQHSMVPGQFMPSVPPPNFTPDTSNMMAAPPNMISNITSLPSSRPHSHGYYNPPSSYMSPNIMLTHLPPPPTPSPLSSQPNPLTSMLPSQQSYYQNSFTNNTPPPLPVPYPHHALNEMPAAGSIASSTTMHTSSGQHSHRPDMAEPQDAAAPATYAYDYHNSLHAALHTPVDEIPIPSDDQTPVYADHPYDYEKNVASTIASAVTSAQEQHQLLQELQQQQQLQEQQQQEQELLQQRQQQEQEQQQLQQQQPVCSAKELSAAIAAVAAADITKLKLPPKWKAARDAEGRIYYYHTKTRISQWYPPEWEEPPPVADVVEQVEEGDYSSEDESSADEEDELVETKKRRRSSKYDHVNVFAKRLHREGGEKGAEQTSFDMDAEIRENLAAMSSEFQDSDNEDYSPVTKDIEESKGDLSDNEQANNANSPPSTIPLITEHIISPREPIDEKERIRNKRRIKMLKERLRRQKKQKLLESLNGENAALMDGSNGVNLGDTISSSSSKLLSVPADTSNLTDRKRKDIFRSNMANFVVNCLNPYFRRGCTIGRITNGEDFKHLARKLTHFVMLKELKHCRNATDLTCNSSVKHKAKEYIRKYMSKFGEVYVRPPDEANF